MTPREKFLAAFLLFATWAAFVIAGLADAKTFVDSLRQALIALGVFQAALADPKGKP